MIAGLFDVIPKDIPVGERRSLPSLPGFNIPKWPGAKNSDPKLRVYRPDPGDFDDGLPQTYYYDIKDVESGNETGKYYAEPEHALKEWNANIRHRKEMLKIRKHALGYKNTWIQNAS